ncbi:Uncharacterised protein [Mesomycoplasma hyorhinis]|nr:Uncharacterised protein [Mesomycoplasma hyorhinis]
MVEIAISIVSLVLFSSGLSLNCAGFVLILLGTQTTFKKLSKKLEVETLYLVSNSVFPYKGLLLHCFKGTL